MIDNLRLTNNNKGEISSSSDQDTFIFSKIDSPILYTTRHTYIIYRIIVMHKDG